MPLRVSWNGVLGGAVIGFVTVMLASGSPTKKAAAVSPQAAVTGNINHKNNLRIKNASSTRLLHVDTAMGLKHAFSNKKSMVFITGSFAISIVPGWQDTIVRRQGQKRLVFGRQYLLPRLWNHQIFPLFVPARGNLPELPLPRIP